MIAVTPLGGIAALVAATLSGCSTTKHPTLERSDRSNASIRIDARPGFYESFRSQLESGADAEAKTFRYLDEEEIAKQRAAAKAKEKGKGKK